VLYRTILGGVMRGDEYDAAMAQRLAGRNPHGEADFVQEVCGRAFEALEPEGVAVLDGGCGTGRVGIELARRGFDVTGVDVDVGMLEVARQKAPNLRWVVGDLAEVRFERLFDLVVLAGNVMIFVGRGREGAVLGNLAGLLRAGGCLVAGFQLAAGGFQVGDYDELAAAAGLELVERWRTWGRDPFVAGGEYAVSVHRRVGGNRS
jgi:SAM-dependent methyltransferase